MHGRVLGAGGLPPPVTEPEYVVRRWRLPWRRVPRCVTEVLMRESCAILKSTFRPDPWP